MNLIRILRGLGFTLLAAALFGAASGCARPERGVADTYADNPPYAMPSSLFTVP